MFALLSVMAINAQNWTGPSGNDYQTSTPIYLQVKVNGVVATSNDGLEVAAFINEECRAVTFTYDANASNLLTLRVLLSRFSTICMDCFILLVKQCSLQAKQWRKCRMN